MRPPPSQLLQAVRDYWGFAQLRPLQEEAMRAVLDRHDSLVVMPTGGGKSLCYQAPAAARTDETTVVVSPLIALMKDQVDSLTAIGVPARPFNSAMTESERTATLDALKTGAVRLLYVSPERLALDGFRKCLLRANVRTFAIDEAHCISHWGHDFRPEYRQMGQLREWFPDASVHALTATATEAVREDIVRQLGLRDPRVLVGNFDRPNLVYRVVPRTDSYAQVRDVLDRHKGEAGIVYCISRKEVDELAARLQSDGFGAKGYHAGMTPNARKEAQEAFRGGSCDLIVATVAFGMGIDRPDIRFVLHTGMPKSVEHYQQEAGRAGRDGLAAECVLLTSGKDVMTWKFIINKSADEAGAGPEFVANAIKQLDAMSGYCRNPRCRHRQLVEHFGQTWKAEVRGEERGVREESTSSPSRSSLLSPHPSLQGCGACDVCLGEVETEADSTVIAQKILSCVARVKESFGIGHVVSVLRGENAEPVRRRGHDQLSTFGLLKGHTADQVRDWAYQLVSQGLLDQSDGQYPLAKLNAQSWEVLRGQREVRLTRKAAKRSRSRAEDVSWEGVDRGLFDELRALRKELADAAQVPPYVVFNDYTLREVARLRPTTPAALRLVSGVGAQKLALYGERFLAAVRDYCGRAGIAADVPDAAAPAAPVVANVSKHAASAYPYFRRGASVAEVMEELGRSAPTVYEYLAAWVEAERPADVSAWVPPETYGRVVAAARRVGAGRLKPIFLELGERVSYDDIKVVLAHARATAGGGN